LYLRTHDYKLAFVTNSHHITPIQSCNICNIQLKEQNKLKHHCLVHKSTVIASYKLCPLRHYCIYGLIIVLCCGNLDHAIIYFVKLCKTFVNCKQRLILNTLFSHSAIQYCTVLCSTAMYCILH